jgi:hypothetical protein
MEHSSRRVAELSDKIYHVMRQWGSASISELENELPGTERPLLDAAMKRLVDQRRVRPADHSGVFRPR